MTLAGGCRCGAVRYTLAAEAPPPVYCCHCSACQSWSGSAFTEQAPVRAAALTVEGQLSTFTYQTGSGATSTHSACSACFSRVFNVNERLPGWVLLRVGTLDLSDTLVPRGHIWVSRKQPWVTLPDGVPVWPENAPTPEFMAMLELA